MLRHPGGFLVCRTHTLQRSGPRHSTWTPEVWRAPFIGVKYCYDRWTARRARTSPRRRDCACWRRARFRAGIIAELRHLLDISIFGFSEEGRPARCSDRPRQIAQHAAGRAGLSITGRLSAAVSANAWTAAEHGWAGMMCGRWRNCSARNFQLPDRSPALAPPTVLPPSRRSRRAVRISRGRMPVSRRRCQSQCKSALWLSPGNWAVPSEVYATLWVGAVGSNLFQWPLMP